MKRLQKYATEVFPVTVDFSEELPLGSSIDSATVSAKRLSTGEADNTILQGTVGTVDVDTVTFSIVSGVAGAIYLITVTAELTSSTDVLVQKLILEVLNP